MKKTCFLFSCLLLSLTGSFAQNYEKGYIIDNKDQKIECDIDNKDWSINPSEFSYRLNDQSHTGNRSNVREFGVYDYSAYEKYIVKVAYPTKAVEDEENYLWQTDTLFLKVLVKGNPSLYTFTGAFSPVFFYKTDQDAVPLQLKYKVSSPNGEVKKDNTYRNQISYLARNCKGTATSFLNRLDYKTKNLVDAFKKMNECNQVNYTEIKRPQPSSIVAHLQFRPGFVMNKLSLTSFSDKPYNSDFTYTSGLKPSYRIGLALELSSRAKLKTWSLLLDLSYQGFDDVKRLNIDYKFYASFKEINLIVGIRKYFVNTAGLKMYAGAYLGINTLQIKPKLDYKYVYANSGIETAVFKLDKVQSFSFNIGTGIKYKRLGLEITYGIPHGITSNDNWDSKFSSVSAIGSFDLF